MNEVVEQIKNAQHEQIPELAKDKFIQVYSQKFGLQQAVDCQRNSQNRRKQPSYYLAGIIGK